MTNLNVDRAYKHIFFENLSPMSVSIGFVTPGSSVTQLAEKRSKHAEPGVAFLGTHARELNLNFTFIS